MKPSTRREDTAHELHGRKIPDPYAWLEADGPAVEAWIGEQDAYLRENLDSALVDRLRERFEAMSRYRQLGLPVRKGGRLFRTERAAEADQATLRVRDAGGTERVLVDPGSSAIDWWYPSDDGGLVAYGTSAGGDEWSTLRVISADGALLPDEIPRTRAAAVAWDPDGTGFLYTRYPAVGEVPPGEETYHRRVLHHRLGTDPALDPVVFADPDPEGWSSALRRGRWVITTVHRGWTRADVYVADWEGDRKFRPLIEGIEASGVGEIVGDDLFWHTDRGAPRGRIVRYDLRTARGPDDAVEVVPEPAHGTIDGFAVIDGAILVSTLVDAASTLAWHTRDGRKIADIPLPELGTLAGLSGAPEDTTAFAAFSSFQRPTAILEVDASGSRVWDEPVLSFDPGFLVTERRWFTSRDGTPVSMFVVRHRDTPLDGHRPAVLAGYGGFSISRTPAFSVSIVPFLLAGGVYASAQLRGGGEYGKEWHLAGMRANKQNTFDDAIAAAEALRPFADRIAVMGGSNGGLLVGALVTQAPELWTAAVCMVPLLDMLRYHRFLLGRLWIPEYGDPEDAEHYAWIAPYSPYHRVRDDVDYPPMLITTGDGDTRVHPMHARKMTALLQASRGGPTLLRYERGAGHGIGKGRSAAVQELADVWAFLWKELRVGGLP